MVKGVKIPIITEPIQTSNRSQIPGNQMKFVDIEVEKLLKLGVIDISAHEENEIVSPIFLVPKPDGTFRMILNLKMFNTSVEYDHFKMENFSTVLSMISKGCYLGSIDLRHAYYSVSIDSFYRKFLKFEWRGVLYEFTCMANGLACCPRYFTKLLKPIYATLRAQGFLSTAFIDDSCLMGDTYDQCLKNIETTKNLFESLGFIVHSEKSVMIPCKKLKYLGFWIDTEKMQVTLPDDKISKVKLECSNLMNASVITIRDLAKVIGILVSCFPAVLWGPLYYRNLDADKIEALRLNYGNFDALTVLGNKAKPELLWWINNVENQFYPIERSEPEIEFSTDASNDGWGIYCDSEISTSGQWSETEKQFHINALELLAIEYGLKSLENVVAGKHVKILSDNSCAVSNIKSMGGKSKTCNDIVFRIWTWCQSKNVWITISFLPGILNVNADKLSRKFDDRTEWMLNPKCFDKICKYFGTPQVDLFASRLNCQMKPFVSWRPDPEAVAIDAFSINWSKWEFVYAFPPFNLITGVLKKWRDDGAKGVIIVPCWETAPWYPMLIKMMTQNPLLFPRKKQTLTQPVNKQPHPLYRQMQVMACIL